MTVILINPLTIKLQMNSKINCQNYDLQQRNIVTTD